MGSFREFLSFLCLLVFLFYYYPVLVSRVVLNFLAHHKELILVQKITSEIDIVGGQRPQNTCCCIDFGLFLVKTLAEMHLMKN